MIINNEHKLGRAVDQILKSEISYNYAHCTRLRLTILAFHIIHAPAEARSRDLPVPRPAFFQWAMDPLLPVRFRQIMFSVQVEKMTRSIGGQGSDLGVPIEKHTRGRGPWFLASHQIPFTGFRELPRKRKYESSRRTDNRQATRDHNSALEPSA